MNDHDPATDLSDHQAFALADEIERLTDGRTLSAADSESVATVAGLTLRLRAARDMIATAGIIIADSRGELVEHPAVKIERQTSAELRGWAKSRPDLFGEGKAARPKRNRFEGFKAV